MILLTADRPDELRGIRSNQTTHQPGMFGVAARLSLDVPAPVGDSTEAQTAVDLARRATDAATGVHSADPGPVQLNLAFREPLSAAVAWPRHVPQPEPDRVATANGNDAAAAIAGPTLDPAPGPNRVEARVTLAAGPRTVVIAGHGSGPEAEEIARSGGWPLLAEVSSGSRFGPNLIVAYRELLADDDFGGRIERAIVFGHPTLSREVPAAIARAGVETIVVAPTGNEFYNPGHRVAVFARRVVTDAASVAPAAPAAREWLGRWVMTSRHALEVAAASDTAAIGERGISRAELAHMRAPVTRAMLVEAVWRSSWPHDRLVLGASRLIREADRRVTGKKITVHSNRGLAGIDGTIATALGIAFASQAGPDPRSTGVTRVLLGDLALLHDAGSLLLDPREPLPRVQIVVGNDEGGTIFDALEVAATAAPDDLDRVLITPRKVDLSALASAYGWDYVCAGTRTELEHALTGVPAGPSILEVPLSR